MIAMNATNDCSRHLACSCMPHGGGAAPSLSPHSRWWRNRVPGVLPGHRADCSIFSRRTFVPRERLLVMSAFAQTPPQAQPVQDGKSKGRDGLSHS